MGEIPKLQTQRDVLIGKNQVIRAHLEQNQNLRQIHKEDQARIQLTIDDLHEKVQRSKQSMRRGRTRTNQEGGDQDPSKTKPKKQSIQTKMNQKNSTEKKSLTQILIDKLEHIQEDTINLVKVNRAFKEEF